MLPGCLLKERNVEMHNAMLSSVIFPRRRADFKIFQQLIPLPGDLLSSGSLLASPSPSAIEAARFLSGRALDSFKECGRLMCIGIGEGAYKEEGGGLPTWWFLGSSISVFVSFECVHRVDVVSTTKCVVFTAIERMGSCSRVVEGTCQWNVRSRDDWVQRSGVGLDEQV
ncbi:hypothetical protein AHAS_Ahas15G0035800 [Arachis hypogaea]